MGKEIKRGDPDVGGEIFAIRYDTANADRSIDTRSLSTPASEADDSMFRLSVLS